MVEVGTFVFSPTDDEHFLPVTVIEDEIAEEEEEVTVVITVPGNQPPHIISLTVLDNDGILIGSHHMWHMTKCSQANRSSIQLCT